MENNNPGFITDRKRSRRHLVVRLSDFGSANDITITLNSIEEAQKTLIDVERASAKVGFQLNTKNTKLLFTNKIEQEKNTQRYMSKYF